MPTSVQKRKALKQLAEKRRQTDPNVLFRQTDPNVLLGKHYYCVGEFAGGIYDCLDHVSPWSKSAQNVDTAIMVVGQDWALEKRLNGPVNDHRVKHGYDLDVPANKNVQELLKTHFLKDFCDVYATNAFPFIKPGKLTGPIPEDHMRLAVQEFLLPQIQIIEPQIVICLGKDAFNAVRESCGHVKLRTLDAAIKAPFDFDYDQSRPRFSILTFIGGPHRRSSRIFAVAHTGYFGTISRGRDQVEKDWASIRRLFPGL